MTRPRGSPPMPSAMSRPSEPVEMTSTSAAASRAPSFMIEPLPKARSICPSAASRARCLSIASLSNRRNAGCMIRSSVIPQPPGPRNARRKYLLCSKNTIGTLRSSRALRRLAAHYVFHLAGELFEAEGFGEEVDVAIGVEALAERILGVAGDEDHLHVGVTFAHLAHETGAVHARHHDVGDQQVDLVGVRLDQLQGLLATLRLDDGVALVAQGAGAEDADRVLVLDQHDGANAGQVLGGPGGIGVDASGEARVGDVMAGQVDVEHRPLPHRAVDED